MFTRPILRLAAIASVLLAAAAPAAAQFSSLTVFGDSLTDSGNNALVIGANGTQVITGNTYIPSQPYASGTYSNGATWVSSFAAGIGLAPSALPSLAGGGNYAFGGARTTIDGPVAGFPVSAATQLGGFLTNAPATLAGSGEDTFVTTPFTLEGRTSNVELELDTSLDNAWLYFDLALVNEATGDTRTVGREISYYHGGTSTDRWWEGSRGESVVMGRVPAGRYLLRVEMAGDTTEAARSAPPVSVTLTVRRDVPMYAPYGFALLALVLPALVSPLRKSSFEQRRWAESDHAPVASDEEEDE
jgi:hypothetical protein